MKYTSVDQALEAISFQELPTSSGNNTDVRRDVKGAFRPALDSIYRSQLPDNVKEQVIGSIVETAVPTLLRTFSKHWSSIKAA